jgi:hypothetical protein
MYKKIKILVLVPIGYVLIFEISVPKKQGRAAKMLKSKKEKTI